MAALGRILVHLLLSVAAARTPKPFIRVDGLYLYEGSKPFRFLAANVYWLMAEASYGESGRENVRAVLDRAVSLGVSVVRTWAFADGWSAPKLQPRQGQFDPNVLAALDFVVAEAGARNLRLLLPLLNYWTDYGGVAVYERWRDQGTAALGSAAVALWQPTSDCPLFYSHPTSHAHFQAMVDAVLRHANQLTGLALRDDPTILGWELCNECRCRGEGRVSELQGWASSMVGYVKRVAPKQLVGVGVEGFYRSQSGHMDAARADALNPSDWYAHDDRSVHFQFHTTFHDLP